MMQKALTYAETAAACDEIPIGAVIYTEAGDVIAAAHNQTIATRETIAHAEIIALRRANEVAGNYRLPHLNMVVTLEPCAMCIGAIFHARLAQLIYAAADDKSGVCGSIIDLPADKRLNHHTAVCGGLMAAEAAVLLRDFFRQRR